MKPEAQRIAMAEACGWRCLNDQRMKREGKAIYHKGNFYCTVWANGSLGGDLFPDYLSDLNAMHEAEKVLTSEQLESYGMLLSGPKGERVSLYCPEGKEIAAVAMATASKRAEAFLRTLGRWEEGK